MSDVNEKDREEARTEADRIFERGIHSLAQHIWIEARYDESTPEDLRVHLRRIRADAKRDALLTAEPEPCESVSDEMLWQEIFSLREQLKIAASIVKSYEPDFDTREFLASLGHMDFQEWLDLDHRIQEMQAENGHRDPHIRQIIMWANGCIEEEHTPTYDELNRVIESANAALSTHPDKGDGGHHRIYVASSWKNEEQPGIVWLLRAAGHEVYDFRHPQEGDDGFSWSEIDPAWKNWTPDQYLAALEHPADHRGFGLDWSAMEWADTGVLVLPCGKSAHLEAGYFVGARKRLFILMLDQDTPELMYKMATKVCTSEDELASEVSRRIKDTQS